MNLSKSNQITSCTCINIVLGDKYESKTNYNVLTTNAIDCKMVPPGV